MVSVDKQIKLSNKIMKIIHKRNISLHEALSEIKKVEKRLISDLMEQY